MQSAFLPANAVAKGTVHRPRSGLQEAGIILAAAHCDGIDSAMEPGNVAEALKAAPSTIAIAKFASNRYPGPPTIDIPQW